MRSCSRSRSRNEPRLRCGTRNRDPTSPRTAQKDSAGRSDSRSICAGTEISQVAFLGIIATGMDGCARRRTRRLSFAARSIGARAAEDHERNRQPSDATSTTLADVSAHKVPSASREYLAAHAQSTSDSRAGVLRVARHRVVDLVCACLVLHDLACPGGRAKELPHRVDPVARSVLDWRREDVGERITTKWQILLTVDLVR